MSYIGVSTYVRTYGGIQEYKDENHNGEANGIRTWNRKWTLDSRRGLEALLW